MFRNRGLVFLPVLLALALASRAESETFQCTGGDPGCVIASMAKANANGPEHDYLFLGAGTYALTRKDNEPIVNDGPNGLPVNAGALTIIGAGQGVTWLGRAEGAPFFRIFDNAPTGGLTIYGVTIANGELDLRFFQRGGCIRNAGSMMLISSTVRECAAWLGGGIDNVGEILVRQVVAIESFAEFACGGIAGIGKTIIEQGSWVGDNVAETGAGVCSGHLGPLTVLNSVIDGNIATLGNGGGLSGDGPINVQSTLISENFSSLRGGGVHHFGGTIDIQNSTLWDNNAEIDGGGAYVEAGEANLQDVAVLYNSAGIPELGFGSGGGIKTTDRGIARLNRVWLLWNEAVKGAQCNGNVQLQGWAVIGDPSRFHPEDQPPCQ